MFFYANNQLKPLRFLWLLAWFVLLNALTHGLLWQVMRSVALFVFVLFLVLIFPVVLRIARIRRSQPNRQSARPQETVIDVTAEVVRDESSARKPEH